MKTRLNISQFLWLGLLLLTFSTCREDSFEPELFGSIIGEVFLEEENIGIEQVTISTNPPTSQVLTDDLGRFAFDNLKTGTYSLRAEKNGFIAQVASVTVFNNQTSNVILRMRPDSLDNNLPSIPATPSPEDGSINQSTDFTLSWSSSDENDDILSYEVILFNADQTLSTVLTSNQTDTMYQISGLEYATNYFWQVIVDDGIGDLVYGPVWGFRTEDFPDLRYLFAREDNGKYDIFAADANGLEIQLTDNSASNWRPRMNSARTKIAFITNNGIEPQLYIMDRDGSNSQMISDIPISGTNSLQLDFCWSPDGTQLLYMVNSKLYTINSDGSGLSLFAEAPFGYTFAECDWTAQGNKIVARTEGNNSYNSTAFTFDENGNYQLQVLTDMAGTTGGPVFSIDGNQILYTHDVSGFESPDGRQLDSHVFIKNLQNNSVTDISVEKPDGFNDLDPRFSPDGAKIIFVQTNNDGISPRSIWMMDLDGDNRTLLFENAEMPEWK